MTPSPSPSKSYLIECPKSGPTAKECNGMDDNAKADDLIPGSLKRSVSYHTEYGKKKYGKIKRLAKSKPPERNARPMKKLLAQAARLLEKARKRGS